MDQSGRKLILAVAAYSSASVLGPMLFFGIIGYFIDKNFGTNPKFLLIGIGIAFVVSNFLLFRNRRIYSKKVFKQDKKINNE